MAITKAFLKIFGIVLSSLTGNPLAGFAAGVAANNFSPLTSGGLPGAPTSSMGGGGGNTYYITTISAKDLLSSLVAPTGQMRSANSRLSEVAAVS